MLSSAFESGVGMVALVALASTFSAGAVGFGTYSYLAADVGRPIPQLLEPVLRIKDMPENFDNHIDMDMLTEL